MPKHDPPGDDAALLERERELMELDCAIRAADENREAINYTLFDRRDELMGRIFNTPAAGLAGLAVHARAYLSEREGEFADSDEGEEPQVTLALAPGVVANLVLKEHWGRPRPIDVAEFGGDEHFRPWWDPRGDCPKNCSFIAGEPSGAFWTMAGAAVVPLQWRALAYGSALAFGAAVGVLRMAAGAHFFSDVVFAGVFSFLVIWLVHGWLYRWPRMRISDEAVERALERIGPRRV